MSIRRTPAEQQPHRADDLGANQAAYEALNMAHLKAAPHAHRDLIWAATEHCGLGSVPRGLGSVPRKRSAAPADPATITQAAKRNALLREQGLRIPWDHVTEWEVTHFWTGERGLAADSPLVQRLYANATGSSYKAGEPLSLWLYM